MAEVASGTERHRVYRQGEARLRLCLRFSPGLAVPAFSIPCDANGRLRLVAAARLQRATRGNRNALDAIFMPTHNQRHRLIQFLTIHDALEAGASARDVAFGLVMPNHRPLAGAVWKGSNERRQVLRLIAEARRLVSNGYRKLLLHR